MSLHYDAKKVCPNLEIIDLVSEGHFMFTENFKELLGNFSHSELRELFTIWVTNLEHLQQELEVDIQKEHNKSRKKEASWKLVELIEDYSLVKLCKERVFEQSY